MIQAWNTWNQTLAIRAIAQISKERNGLSEESLSEQTQLMVNLVKELNCIKSN